MTNFVLLDPKEHAELKVITERSADYGDNVKYAMTFPFEFRNIQSCYPIFFQKDADSGKFFPLALFGFENDENLFLSDTGWNASYIPIMIKRQPFLIGFQQDPENSEGKKAVVSIDMDNPRVNETEGEPLFMEHGGGSDFLQKTAGTLELIHQAHQHSEQFVNALIEHDLLESFSLDIELNDGSGNQLLGFYTINEDSVQQLTAEALGSLND
ncbi:MAG: SapC family protein, partial [Gammaproteobacteria bacterium]|nr:SapC family protein [Gammaproteobacteria bacterium]